MFIANPCYKCEPFLTRSVFQSESEESSHMKITLSLISLLILAAMAGAQGPAETRAREIAALINSGDRAAVRKYVEANFNEQMRGLPMNQHLSFFSFEHDQ